MRLSIEQVAQKLKEVKRRGAGFDACCPAHEDRKPSLSVDPGKKGGLVLKCHAGCETEAVLEALGMTFADVRPDRADSAKAAKMAKVPNKKASPQTWAPWPSSGEDGHLQRNPPASGGSWPSVGEAVAALSRSHGPEVARWEYQSSDGATVMTVVRFGKPPDKTFRPLRHYRDGTIGSGKPEGPLPLYQLPRLAGTATVFVGEGEKVADAVTGLGLVCTASSFGAGSSSKTDWTPLAGKSVVLLPDQDNAGAKYVQEVQRHLAGLHPRPEVRVLQLPGLGDGEDAVEYIEHLQAQGLSHEAIRDQFLQLADQAPIAADDPDKDRSGVIVTPMSKIVPEEVQWLWEGRIPHGNLTILGGDPGLGKSTVTLDLAARVSAGRPMPGFDEAVEPGSVVLLSLEDDPASTIRPRLDAAGADVSKVFIIEGVATDQDPASRRTLRIPEDLERLEEAITIARATCPCRLVIVDPIAAFLCGRDGNSTSDVRALLDPLAGLARRSSVSVLVVQHLNKAASTANYRLQGSTAFLAVARSVLLVNKHPEDDDLRVLSHSKSNVSAMQQGITFEFTGEPHPAVAWGESISLSADEIMNQQRGGNGASRLDDAKEFLQECLRDGPRPSTEIHEEAREEGLSRKTVERAKKTLGIKPQKEGNRGGWTWALPKNGGVRENQGDPKVAKMAKGASTKDLAILADNESVEAVPLSRVQGWSLMEAMGLSAGERLELKRLQEHLGPDQNAGTRLAELVTHGVIQPQGVSASSGQYSSGHYVVRPRPIDTSDPLELQAQDDAGSAPVRARA